MTLISDSLRTRFTPLLRPLRLEQPLSLSLWLWPVLWSSWIAAAAHPAPAVLLRLLIAVVLARAAAILVVEGPRAAVSLSTEQARLFALAVGLAALSLTAFSLDTVLLAVGGAALGALYLPLRRRSHLGELLLAPAAAVPSLIAFAAYTGHLGRLAWLMFVLHALWVALQATAAAAVRRETDLKSGFGSTAILFDRALPGALWTLSGMLLTGVLLLGREFTLSATYYSALAGAAVCLLGQGWLARGSADGVAGGMVLNAAGALIWAAVLALGSVAV